MTSAPRLGRLRLRRIAVAVPSGTAPRLGVGVRPSAAVEARPKADRDDADDAAPPWSRGLWGTFLPDRRRQRHPLPPDRPDRRCA